MNRGGGLHRQRRGCGRGGVTAAFKSVLVGVAGFILTSLSACNRQVEEATVVRPVIAMQIEAPGFLVDRSFPGKAKAVDEANIAFEVSGRLIERPVNIGDGVEKGQVLAKLDPRDLQNALASARANRMQALALRDRMAEALKLDAVAQQDLTDAQARYEAAVAEVEIARKALEDSVIRAPFAGEVSAIHVENFENVKAKQVVIRLINHAQIEMIVNIPENLISRAPYVEKVIVRFDAFPSHEFTAGIKEIGSEASATTRTYPVTLIMDQLEDIKVLPGMAGRTERIVGNIPGDAASTGLEIPVAALLGAGGRQGSYVWVIDPATGIVSQRRVVVDSLSNRGVLVVDGLTVGDWIAVSGVHYLDDGQQVRIMVADKRSASL